MWYKLQTFVTNELSMLLCTIKIKNVLIFYDYFLICSIGYIYWYFAPSSQLSNTVQIIKKVLKTEGFEGTYLIFLTFYFEIIIWHNLQKYRNIEPLCRATFQSASKMTSRIWKKMFASHFIWRRMLLKEWLKDQVNSWCFFVSTSMD